MACACFTRNCQSSCSVRDAPGLFCQGCARSVPWGTPTPSPRFSGSAHSKALTGGVFCKCGKQRSYYPVNSATNPVKHSDPLELLILNDLGVFTSGSEMRMLSLRGNASLEYNIQ